MANGARKIASVEELRRICQEPVRDRNDMSGALYGQRLSIHLTRLFLNLGLSPAVASSLMLLCGVGGSLLLLLPGWWRVAGLAVLTLAYVLDCVDGEMARFLSIDSLRWAALDLFHHMATKGLSFLCLGMGLQLEYGAPWAAVTGGFVSVLWLLQLGIRDIAALLFAKKIVLDDERVANPAFQRLQKSLEREDNGSPTPKVVAPPRGKIHDGQDIWGRDFRFQPWMIRTFFFTFDLVVPLFLCAAIADRFVAPMHWLGIPLSLTTALLYLYAMLLPLHTVDMALSALRRGGKVRDELFEMARRIQRFRDGP